MLRERTRPLRGEMKFEFARSTRQKMINPRPMTTPEAPVCTYAATVGCGKRLQRLRGLACCRCGFSSVRRGKRRRRSAAFPARGAPAAPTRARVRARTATGVTRIQRALFPRWAGPGRHASRPAADRMSASGGPR
jgi:hypothetical protein